MSLRTRDAFLGEVTLPCPDATDANDDGLVDISDMMRVLFFLFVTGDPLPYPAHVLVEVFGVSFELVDQMPLRLLSVFAPENTAVEVGGIVVRADARVEKTIALARAEHAATAAEFGSGVPVDEARGGVVGAFDESRRRTVAAKYVVGACDLIDVIEDQSAVIAFLRSL